MVRIDKSDSFPQIIIYIISNLLIVSIYGNNFGIIKTFISQKVTEMTDLPIPKEWAFEMIKGVIILYNNWSKGFKVIFIYYLL